jgi:hypothetical protein
VIDLHYIVRRLTAMRYIQTGFTALWAPIENHSFLLIGLLAQVCLVPIPCRRSVCGVCFLLSSPYHFARFLPQLLERCLPRLRSPVFSPVSPSLSRDVVVDHQGVAETETTSTVSGLLLPHDSSIPSIIPLPDFRSIRTAGDSWST